MSAVTGLCDYGWWLALAVFDNLRNATAKSNNVQAGKGKSLQSSIYEDLLDKKVSGRSFPELLVPRIRKYVNEHDR